MSWLSAEHNGHRIYFGRQDACPLLLLGDAQLAELGGDVGAVGLGLYLFVDGQDFAVGANIERPTLGGFAFRRFVQDTVAGRDAAVGIAEDRIISAKRLGELL